MSALLFLLLVISFFIALAMSFSVNNEKTFSNTCLAYVAGGLAMAALYELYNTVWMA